jgi:leucyl-tRNA synthetase
MFDPAQAHWLPVDQYTGGPEHAVMHLLYTRFFTKAMRDIGLVTFDEPMLRLFHQGIILGPDGKRMSKSKGNVVLPDSLVEQAGADAVRLFLMFIGPWEQGGPWNPRGFDGIVRFLNRVWTVATTARPSPNGQRPAAEEERALRRLTHQTIRKVSEDIERFAFNTQVAALMEFVNGLMKVRETALVATPAWEEAIETLALLLAPSAPHIAEELWERLGRPYSVHLQNWPTWDPELAADETVAVVVQVNGKVREHLSVPPGLPREELEAKALATEKVQAALAGKPARKVIVVPDKLVNVVV